MNWYKKAFTNPKNTALLVIDIQNDFTNSPFGVPDGASIVPEINAAIADARSKGIPVIFTRHLYDANDEKVKGQSPQYCMRDTFGGSFTSDLSFQPDDTVFDKKEYSGFSGVNPKDSKTSLEQHLKAHGITNLIIVGLAFDYCVKHTAMEAQSKGFKVTVIQKATKGYSNPQQTHQELTQQGVEVA